MAATPQPSSATFQSTLKLWETILSSMSSRLCMIEQPERFGEGAGVAAYIAALFHIRFLRFVLVGVMNTAFSYLVYALALLVGLNYALASLIAVVAGVFFSFRTQGTLVFGNARSEEHTSELQSHVNLVCRLLLEKKKH